MVAATGDGVRVPSPGLTWADHGAVIYPGLQEPPLLHPLLGRLCQGRRGVGAASESGRKVGLGGHSPTVPAGSGFPGAAVLACGGGRGSGGEGLGGSGGRGRASAPAAQSCVTMCCVSCRTGTVAQSYF